MTKLKDHEIDERVAILTKLRNALAAQRDKFKQYLAVLEHQEQDILAKDTDKLEAHVELEQSIVREIFAFQKVIDPLQDMYRMAYPMREREIPALQTSLSHLKEQVMERNQQNQDLLREHMSELRQKIADIRSVKQRNPVYAGQPEPSLVDIVT